jgi:hypothetical protein
VPAPLFGPVVASLTSASRDGAALPGCHDGRVAIAPGTPINRRAFLIGAGSFGTVALLGVTGCSYFGSDEPAAPTAEATPAALDPINGLIATTRLHLLRLNAAIAADATDAPRLTPLRDDRQAQLTALEAEYARLHPADPSATAVSSATAAAPTTGAVVLPDSPEAIISAVRGDAATAQVQFTDAISSASRFRAAMFGSIAAALASHRAVLA